MSLFSFLRKNKQESDSDGRTSHPRTEEDSSAARGRGKRKKGNSEKDPIDPVLPEKKRARRRLIGAIALVLAAVIGLPMLLDSEPRPLADNIAIEIPSRDKPAKAEANRTATSPAPAIPPSASLDPREEMVEPEAAIPARPDSSQQPSASTAVSPAKGVTEKPREVIKAPPPAKDTAPEKPAPVPSKTEPKVAEKGDDSMRARALLEGKPDPKDADEKKPAKFVIQVAALTTKEKVSEVQAKLKGAGINSYTQRIATESGDRIRIRVGPFTSREEADKMRARIGKLGMNGTIVPA